MLKIKDAPSTILPALPPGPSSPVPMAWVGDPNAGARRGASWVPSQSARHRGGARTAARPLQDARWRTSDTQARHLERDKNDSNIGKYQHTRAGHEPTGGWKYFELLVLV